MVSQRIWVGQSQVVRDLEEWELCEEIFWKRKAQIDWLQEGNGNTAFFHKSVQALWNGGYISSLVNSKSIHLTSLQDLCCEATQYYSALFSEDSPPAGAGENMVLACIPTLVTNLMNKSLMCPVSLPELKEVVLERLKVWLPNLISGEKGGFVASRQILDGVVITSEAIHSMAISRDKSMFIKLDMAKAYDRVKWRFLEKLLISFGFSQEWVNWMMSCVTPYSFSVIINDELSILFGASRGLHQGDPLSPYVFILMAEGLGRFIKARVSQGLIQGWSWVHGIPTLSHFQFVDDTTLLGAAHLQEAEYFRQTLDIYLASSS
ncbi:uncharacterized protein LOC131044623 [Cryptomeria japonica]|uniref:uncharacterized protein LOC131044623 n=1 Tax=Cryptomeria japonica TaxID=3369 RepID=UPI0025AB74D6|nr:uncharacterized protein LOC131044623 [Cryptomeria japonica]